ncbi:MAG: hypothetical protein WC636_06035 [Candidatus Margulisiibacteriota bacterium]
MYGYSKEEGFMAGEIVAARSIADLKNSSGFWTVDDMYVVKLADGTYAFASTQNTKAGVWYESEREVALLDASNGGKKTLIQGKVELSALAEAKLRDKLSGKTAEQQQAVLRDLYEYGDNQPKLFSVVGGGCGNSSGEELPVAANGTIESLEALLVWQRIEGLSGSSGAVKASTFISELSENQSKSENRQYWIVQLDVKGEAVAGQDEQFVFIVRPDGDRPSGEIILDVEGEAYRAKIKLARKIEYAAVEYLSQLEAHGLEDLERSGEVDGNELLSQVFYCGERDIMANVEDLPVNKKAALSVHGKIFGMEMSFLREFQDWVLAANKGSKYEMNFPGNATPELLSVFDSLKTAYHALAVTRRPLITARIQLSRLQSATDKDSSRRRAELNEYIKSYRDANREDDRIRRTAIAETLDRLNEAYFNPRGLHLMFWQTAAEEPVIFYYRIDGYLNVKIESAGNSAKTIEVILGSRLDEINFDPNSLGMTAGCEIDDPTAVVDLNQIETNDSFSANWFSFLVAKDRIGIDKQYLVDSVAAHEAYHVFVVGGGEGNAYLSQIGFSKQPFQALAGLLSVNIGNSGLEENLFLGLFDKVDLVTAKRWIKALRDNGVDAQTMSLMKNYLANLTEERIRQWARNELFSRTGISDIAIE